MSDRSWPWAAKQYRLTEEDVALLVLADGPRWDFHTFRSQDIKVGDLFWAYRNRERPLIIYRLEATNHESWEWSIVYKGNKRGKRKPAR